MSKHVLEIDENGERWRVLMEEVERQPLPRDTPIGTLVHQTKPDAVHVKYATYFGDVVLDNMAGAVEQGELILVQGLVDKWDKIAPKM